MRRREIPRLSSRMLALENAIDQMPDPATMTPEERRRALAFLNKVSEFATRRMVTAHVKIWMDEYCASAGNCGSKRAS